MIELKFDKQTIDSVNDFINQTWTEYSEKPIIDFLNEIKYKLCVIFSYIYMKLFNMLDLKPYTNNLMFLELK
jgi:hypothetical protein